MSAGGNVTRVTIGGNNYTTTNESTVTIVIGGRKQEKKLNSDGSVRTILTQTKAEIKDIEIAINDNETLETLQGIINSADSVVFSVELAGGTVYSGSGNITGDLEMDTQESSAKITLTSDNPLNRN